jgi:hypothetical protein
VKTFGALFEHLVVLCAWVAAFGRGDAAGVEAGMRWVGGRQVEGLISSLDV